MDIRKDNTTEFVSTLEKMDMAELLDVLDNRFFNILYKLTIEIYSEKDKTLKVVLMKGSEGPVLSEKIAYHHSYPEIGFSALLFAKSGKAIVDIADYNRIFKKIFDIIQFQENQGFVVKCLNIGALQAECFKSHNFFRTYNKAFAFDNMNYHTFDASFSEIKKLHFQMNFLGQLYDELKNIT